MCINSELPPQLHKKDSYFLLHQRYQQQLQPLEETPHIAYFQRLLNALMVCEHPDLRHSSDL